MIRRTDIRCAAVAVVISMAAGGCSFVQETLPAIALSDAEVLNVLDSLSEAHMDAAELALEKDASPAVRAFAARVLSEHRGLIQDNARLARQLSLRPQRSQLASQLRASHDQTIASLRLLSGSAFDRAYLQYEIRQHIRAFQFVETGAANEGTSEVKQQLVRVGPDLLSHISAARAAERHLDGESPNAVAVR